jgi:hypothetical protein
MEDHSSKACPGAATRMTCHPNLTEMTQLICRIQEILQWTRENLVLSEDRKSIRDDRDNYRTYQQAIEHLMRITDTYFSS